MINTKAFFTASFDQLNENRFSTSALVLGQPKTYLKIF